MGDRYAIVWALLRAGASLDSRWGAMPIESRLLQVLRARPSLVSDQWFGMIRDVIRASAKRVIQAVHAGNYDILTLRGLASRDYITSTDPKLNSLVALPNEVLCHVLGYWKAIMPALYDIVLRGLSKLSPPRRRRRGACTKMASRPSVSTCIYFSMCGCQMASPSAMQPVPMTKRICCGRSSVRNGTANPAMKLPIIECAVSSAADHR